MITIFKEKKDIPQNMEYVELNDIFFNQNTATRMDQRAEGIIKQIDDSKLLSKYRICSRFDDIVLNIDKLSAGCKTILNVLYYPDKVFCMKECGNNALEALYELEEGNVFSDYPLIPLDMVPVMVQTQTERQEINDYEALKEWWSNEM